MKNEIWAIADIFTMADVLRPPALYTVTGFAIAFSCTFAAIMVGEATSAAKTSMRKKEIYDLLAHQRSHWALHTSRMHSLPKRFIFVLLNPMFT